MKGEAAAILLFVISFFYFCTTLYVSNANAFEVVEKTHSSFNKTREEFKESILK